MAGDLQKVESEIKSHIKVLHRQARLLERTLSRARHTRLGGPVRPGRRRVAKRRGRK